MTRSSALMLTVLMAAALPAPPASAASEPYLGEIMFVAFKFCPRGWLYADGTTLPIAGNTALFSLLGTRYGGDGQTTFKLPHLRKQVVSEERRNGETLVRALRGCIAVQGIFPPRD